MDTGKGNKVANKLLVQSRKRKATEHPLQQDGYIKIKPLPGTRFEGGNAIDFVFRTGTSAMRMLSRCFFVKFRMLESSDQGNNWTVSANADEKVMLPELLGSTCFVQSVEVQADNVTVSQDTTGNLNLYQAVQRRMCRRSTQKDLGVFRVADTTLELKQLSGNSLNPLNNSAVGSWLVVTGSFDGHPWIGCPRNLTSMCLLPQRGYANTPDIIATNVEIHIRLILHQDLMARFIQTDMDPKYWTLKEKPDGADNITAFEKEGLSRKKYKVQIAGMHFVARKVDFESTVIQKSVLGKDPMHLYLDSPRYGVNLMPDKAQSFSSSHVLPPDTTVVYCIFLCSHQLNVDPVGDRKADISHFFVPPGLTKMSFKLDDSPVTFSNGLEIKAADPQSDEDNLLLYMYLTDLGLVDKHYGEWTCGPTETTLNNIYLLDLSYLPKKSANIKITIDCLFENESPAGWHIAALGFQEGSIKKTGNQTWNSSVYAPGS